MDSLIYPRSWETLGTLDGAAGAEEDERAEVLITIEGVGALHPLEFGNHFVGERRRPPS